MEFLLLGAVVVSGSVVGIMVPMLWLTLAVLALLAARSGKLGTQDVKIVHSVRPRDFERVVNRETRDGWRLTSLVDKVCYEFGQTEPHRELDVVMVKWRLV